MSKSPVCKGVNAAIGSRFGAFLYVKVEKTGRKDTPIFGRQAFDTPKGRRVKITFTEVSFDHGVRFSDSTTGWVLPDQEG
jgi:hypothetical protein